MYIINYDNGMSYYDHSNDIVGWAETIEEAAFFAAKYYTSKTYHTDRFMEIRKCVPNTNEVISCAYVGMTGFRKVSPNEF